MINLPNITLMAMDSLGNSLDSFKAMKYSCKYINFGKKVFLTSDPSKYDSNFCEIIKINKMSYQGLSKFSLLEVHKFFDTDFCLGVHPDGFVINPSLWDNTFLEYDYIGAPWSIENISSNCYINKIFRESLFKNKQIYQVGNGGFCLKSKKILLKIKEKYKEQYDGLADDILTGVVLREDLEKEGIKFPDVFIASKFSCEQQILFNNKKTSSEESFGFHGKTYHEEKINLLKEVS